uniref:RNA binding protein, putative n=1 Tax=Arundo donax TaxID=35708 RepID=A0A0A9AYA0_ARUDO
MAQGSKAWNLVWYAESLEYRIFDNSINLATMIHMGVSLVPKDLVRILAISPDESALSIANFLALII